MAHDARRAFLSCKVNKLLEGEEQQVVCRHYQHVIINIQFVHCKEKVADRTETCVVGLRAIIHNGYRLCVMLLPLPFLKAVRKLVVGDNDVFVDAVNPVDVVKHASEDSAVANLQ